MRDKKSITKKTFRSSKLVPSRKSIKAMKIYLESAELLKKVEIASGKTYEYEVVSIEENAVLIKCGEAEITLKLTKVIEVAD